MERDGILTKAYLIKNVEARIIARDELKEKTIPEVRATGLLPDSDFKKFDVLIQEQKQILSYLNKKIVALEIANVADKSKKVVPERLEVQQLVINSPNKDLFIPELEPKKDGKIKKLLGKLKFWKSNPPKLQDTSEDSSKKAA